jgi:hypothetical protein
MYQLSKYLYLVPKFKSCFTLERSHLEITRRTRIQVKQFK